MLSAPAEPTRTQAPERSLQQRMEALGKANFVRAKRAGLKRDLKAGHGHVSGLLLDPPPWLLTAKVWDVLIALPKFGRVRVNRMLRDAAVSPSKTIGGLSQRQRRELLAMLRSHGR